MQALRKKGLSRTEIAQRLAVSPNTVSKAIRCVQISAELRRRIKQRGIRKSAARKTTQGKTDKPCPACGEILPNSAFYLRKDGKRVSYCKKCQSLYAKARDERYAKEVRTFLNQVKDQPCTDCGESHPPWAMDFDHRKEEKKLFNLSEAAARGLSMKKIRAEIEKCDVVCALCHRYRTFGVSRACSSGVRAPR